MTGIRYRRLAVALVGVNASLLGLRYYYRHGSLSARPGGDKSWAGSRGGRVMTAEEAAQRSEWLRRFRDPRLTNPKTTPADLLLLRDDDDDRPPGARDPGYTIAPSPGKGMGVFATRFIPAHAPILDEEPVLVLPAGGAHMLRAADLHGFVAQVFALAPALREAAAALQGERVALWRPQMEHYGEILRTEAFAAPPPATSDVTDAAAAAAAPDASSGTCGGESQETVVARPRPRPLSLEERSELEHILRVFYTNAAALVAPLRLPSSSPSPSPSSPSSAAAAAAATSHNTTTTTTKMAHVADGLFLTFSRINHACDPNAVWDTCRRRPGVMAIRAARDIRPGEEITIAYFWETTMAEEELAVEQRRARTLGWGFVCQCLKCGPLVGGSSAVE